MKKDEAVVLNIDEFRKQQDLLRPVSVECPTCKTRYFRDHICLSPMKTSILNRLFRIIGRLL